MKNNFTSSIKIKIVLLAATGLLPFIIFFLVIMSLNKGIEKETRKLSSFVLPRVMYGQKIMNNVEKIRILEYRYCFTNDLYERKSLIKEINSCIRETRKTIGFLSNRLMNQIERKNLNNFKKDFEEFITNYRWMTGYMNSGYPDSAQKIFLSQSQANFTVMLRKISPLSVTGIWQASSAVCRMHSRLLTVKMISYGILPVLLVVILILDYTLLNSIFKSSIFKSQTKN